MAWNTPGDSGNKDPWGGGGNKKNEQGPPDLDEVVRQLQNKVTDIFGGKKNSDKGSDGQMSGPGPKGIGLLAVVALIAWGLTGIYIVDPAERGVVLRFGQYVDTTMPGPHWHLPYPIETVTKVDVDQVRTIEVGYRTAGTTTAAVPREALMLTQDENIVDIEVAIQYKVKGAQDYLFNVRDPDLTLGQATESAIREVIGKSTMDFVLTEGRSQVAADTEALIQTILDRYQTGLIVVSVNMQDAQPPEQVQDAFHDAVKAREDEERLKNIAQAYSNDILPKARGDAARQIEEANAYKARVIAESEGRAARFDSVLAEYKKAPQVTRERLYLDSLESVLANSSKVMVDVDGGNNLMYLPLDKMMGGSGASSSSLVPAATGSLLPSAGEQKNQVNNNRNRNDFRSRERQ